MQTAAAVSHGGVATRATRGRLTAPPSMDEARGASGRRLGLGRCFRAGDSRLALGSVGGVAGLVRLARRLLLFLLLLLALLGEILLALLVCVVGLGHGLRSLNDGTFALEGRPALDPRIDRPRH